MTNRQKLLKTLLCTFHLNNVDRQIFKDEPITLTEIKQTILCSLQDKNIFPDTLTIGQNGQITFEGYFIKKINDQNFTLNWQRHQVDNPFQVAEKFEIEYTDIDQLVYDYIDKEYKFNIDGLTINEP